MLFSVVNVLAVGLSRLVSRASAMASSLTMSCVAVTWCVLGLVGSGFDYSVANAAAFADDGGSGSANLLAWDKFLSDALLGSLGIVFAAATVLALSLWTAPQATARVIPPQRHSYGAAD